MFSRSNKKPRMLGIHWHKIRTCRGRTNQVNEATHNAYTDTLTYLHTLMYARTTHTHTLWHMHSHFFKDLEGSISHFFWAWHEPALHIKHADIQKPKIDLPRVGVLGNLDLKKQ